MRYVHQAVMVCQLMTATYPGGNVVSSREWAFVSPDPKILSAHYDAVFPYDSDGLKFYLREAGECRRATGYLTDEQPL